MANLSLKNQLKEIEKKLNKKIHDAMKDEVFEKVRDVMQDHIMDDVYKKYTPYSTDGKTPHYERTYELIRDETIDGKMINDNTLEVKNTRSENDRNIVEVIETGKGYEWGYTRNLDEEIGDRPFIKNTRKDLLEHGQHINALKLGLKKRGVDVG
jgi:hypothetical protein